MPVVRCGASVWTEITIIQTFKRPARIARASAGKRDPAVDLERAVGTTPDQRNAGEGKLQRLPLGLEFLENALEIAW